MDNQKVKIIVTIGPSTNSEQDIKKIKDKGVDFIRINMSHSNLEELKRVIKMAKNVGIPFIIDTQGSQIRTGDLSTDHIELEENQVVNIYAKDIVGNQNEICLKPSHIVEQLTVGDIIHVDFDTLSLRISDTSTISKGYVIAKTITRGRLGRNKAAGMDQALERKISLPPLSEIDYQSIQIGLEEGIGHIAASFMRSGESVDEVRRATQNTMKIISKVECMDALEHLDQIISKSDYILIDRGDLSREVPVEKIPFIQKMIINKARKMNKEVFIATNLLETMIEKRKPTIAEVHDIINTITDGAKGLTLAAETAIGQYPMECINMLNKLIKHSGMLTINADFFNEMQDQFITKLEKANYLLDKGISSSLVPPHGGKLVNRILKDKPDQTYLNSLSKIKISICKQMDVEQIAIGTYSPIEGFMGKDDLQEILDNMRLANGIIWPIPIILDVSEQEAQQLPIGSDVALVDETNEIMAILHLEEKYRYDNNEIVQKMYATSSNEHPGVRDVKNMQPILLAGKIDLIKRKEAKYKEYELTPKQTRMIFEERGWSKVVGFHTRNIIHRGHEFLQLNALEKENCDGLFVHPIIGKKKTGDFHSKYIIKSYELMKELFYPKDKVVFGTFSTYSRYAGPRESLFTALCRKNFGCSHFIVGRDHTGVSNFYHPKASHTIYDRFPELGIKPIKYDKVFFSKKLNQHVHEKDILEYDENDKLDISGTQARKMFESLETPPDWFIRPEISKMIVEAIKNGEEVFVTETDNLQSS